MFDFSEGGILVDGPGDMYQACSQCDQPDDEMEGPKVKQCVCHYDMSTPGCM